MAGTVTGLVDARVGDGGTQPANNNNQELFTVVYNFLNSKYTRIACNFGTAGTGFDFFDGANPSGENAFAVFRANSAANPFNILIQWADSSPFGSSPGNPGLLQASSSSDGVGVMVAFREDGTNPWAGGTANAGADAKGATVWTPGSSTLHVLGRSNTTGGSHATNKENMFTLGDLPSPGQFGRMHCVGDDDGFAILTDISDDGTYQALYAGAYTPRSGLTITHPLCIVINPQLSTFWVTGSAQTYGSTTGYTNYEGGILGRDKTDGVRGLSVVTNIGSFEAAFQPNGQVPTPALDASEIGIIQRETHQGLAGFIPSAIMAAVYGVANLEVNAAGNRAYISMNTVAFNKWSIPWGGGSPPGTSTSRNGVTF